MQEVLDYHGEDHHVLDNLNDHSNEISSVLENSEEIQELEPHEECDNGLDWFFNVKWDWHSVVVEDHHESYEVNTEWGNQINVIPEVK